VKLNIVGRGVFKDHAVFKCNLLNLQCRQGGLLELAETPLVRIRDKRNFFGLNDAIGLIIQGQIGADLLMRNQQTPACQFGVKPGRNKMVKVGCIKSVYLAIKLIVFFKQKPIGIPE
jgi:hypothetical protein